MKKQLLIAAVAATMTSVAMADVSITGQMKAKYTNTDFGSTAVNTNVIASESNLYVAGKSGDSAFRMELNADSGNSNAITTEDLWMSTKIADVTVKAGAWNGSDSLIGPDSARADGKYSASTSVGGVGITLNGSNDLNVEAVLKGSVSGVDLSYTTKIKDNKITLDTNVAGVGISYVNANNDAANTSESAFSLSYETNGATLGYASYTSDTGASNTGDHKFGDLAGLAGNGDDVTAFSVSAALAGNDFMARKTVVDATNDYDITTIEVSRALAAGSDLTVTYTDTDLAGSVASDTTTLDVELAVKF